MIRDIGDCSWLTGALVEGERGNGKGRILFEKLIQNSNGRPWLEVWEDNVPAVALYTALGFNTQYATVSDRTLLTMRLP